MPAQREDWAWEEELMLLGWYDGPLDGWATRAGAVVYYHTDGPGEHRGQRVYALTLVPDAALLHVQVIEQCWDRWSTAFHAGETTHDTHPTLPEDRAAHGASEAALEGLLAERAPSYWAAWAYPTGARAPSAPSLLRWVHITRAEYDAACARVDEGEEP